MSAGWALVVFGLASTSIGALLGELYGVVPMAVSVPTVTAPSLVALAVLGSRRVAKVRERVGGELAARIRVGALAGVAGIIGYDLARVPFEVGGLRVFAPIDSYGLLIAGGDMASALTNTLGWAFHLSNGVTFGIVYAVVAARRHWVLGVAFGLTIESIVFATPFPARYGVSSDVGVILVAYLGHVGFGYPVGRIVQRFDATRRDLAAITARPVTAVLAVVVAALLVWQQPWSESEEHRRAAALSGRLEQPVVVVSGHRFVPEWTRVDVGHCLRVVNPTTAVLATSFGTVPASGSADLCFDERRVERFTPAGRPFSGGFVYVGR